MYPNAELVANLDLIQTGPYDDNYQITLNDYGINRPNLYPRPSNWDHIDTFMKKPRTSPAPGTSSEHDWLEYRKQLQLALNEAAVEHLIYPLIDGTTDYAHAFNQVCTNWEMISEGPVFKNAQPDHYDGHALTPETALLRQHLNKYIVPANKGPFLPNFFCEDKGPKGRLDVAMCQATYDGALGARGMYAARSYCKGDALDMKAYTFSAIMVSGALELYAHFVSRLDPQGTSLQYHMCELRAYNLKNSATTFNEAVAAYRNLKDLANLYRMEVATEAMESIEKQRKAKQLRAYTVPPVELRTGLLPAQTSPSSARAQPSLLREGSGETDPLGED